MSTRGRRQRGSMALEAILWTPILLLFLVGMVQVGKITYVYYTLNKTLNTVASYLAVQQGVDFCNLTGDATVTQAVNLALTGTSDGTAESQFPALTADQISITTECRDATGTGVGQCSTTGCDASAGAQRPDFLVVSLPDGYQVTPRIPYMLIDPILLRPQIRVPFGGS